MKIGKVGLLMFGIVLLLASATFSVAWLSQNHIVTEKGIGVRIDADSVATSKFTVYRYDDASHQAEIVTGEDIVLPKYDSIFTEKNENSILIFRVPVFGETIQNREAFTITLTLKDCSEITGLPFEEDFNYHNGNKASSGAGASTSSEPSGLASAVADFVSNVIYIKCAVIKEEGLQSIEVPSSASYPREADYVYDTVHNYMQTEVSSSECFVTQKSPVSSDGTVTYEKVGEIKFTIEDYEDAMAADASILYVYLEIGYRNELVAHMIETRGMSFEFGGSEDDNIIQIESDLDMFVFDIDSD